MEFQPTSPYSSISVYTVWLRKMGPLVGLEPEPYGFFEGLLNSSFLGVEFIEDLLSKLFFEVGVDLGVDGHGY